MKQLGIIMMVFFVIALSSCEKLFFGKDPANDPVSNFESMWQTIDEKYAFFELKGIDWDEVYQRYRPQVSNDMNSLELFEVLADMLYELRDGHVNLRTSFNVSRNWTWYLDYPENYNSTIVERNYLGDDHFITGPLKNQIIDSVGYIDYRSFASTISDGHLNIVLSRFQDLKGIIIDVRSNGGGSPENAFEIVERIADQERLIYRSQLKDGPGHNDFTELTDFYLGPAGDVRFTGKVVVLANRSTYSAANNFLAMMKAFPNVTIIGDTSGGGGGSPAGYELPNGWSYRFSATRKFMANGWNLESGIPPDIKVDLDPADEANGVDTIIERALEEFN